MRSRWRLALLAAGLALAVQAARAQERALLLDVVINGHDTGLLGSFQQRGSALFATRQELRAIGLLPLARDTAAGEAGVEALSDLPGIAYHIDERQQVLQVSAGAASLVPTTLGRVAPSLPPVRSDTGFVFNYNLVATSASGRALVQGQLDGRVFSRYGVADTGLLVQGGETFRGARSTTRLDSSYSYSDPDSLIRYRAGDVINGGLVWTRPVRLGGAQVTTDFSLRSDLVTFPVPTIAGAVAVPSSVDVLVNDVQLLSRSVPPGPFEVRQLPVVTGAGTVAVAVTNALGQQVTQTLPFYASTAMLAPGLRAFSAEIGSVRMGYGVLSDDYRSIAASSTYRQGVAEWATVEAHAEATPTVAMAGGGASVTVGSLGMVSASVAASTARGRSGGQVYAGFERVSSRVSLTGSVQLSSPGFRDLAAAYGDSAPRLAARAGIGVSLDAAGAVGAQFTMVRRDAVTSAGGAGQAVATDYVPLAGYAFVPPARTTLVSLSYSRPVLGNRAYVYATGFDDLARGRSAGAVAGITIPLGHGIAASASANGGYGQGFATVQATRPAAEIGDVGFQLAASAGRPGRQTGDLQYRAAEALVDVGADRVAGQTAYRASAQGAVAFADGRPFLANTITDSFAVVDTSGVPGIHVLQENRPVGETDGAGTRLVTDLRAFDVNRLAIDPRDVPLDAAFTTPTQTVRPQDRSGVVVHFAVEPVRGALLRLVDAAGQPLALGSRAVLGPGSAAATVGFDGEAFVTGLQAANVLTVTRPDGSACSVRFAFVPQPGALPKLGPLPCRDAGP